MQHHLACAAQHGVGDGAALLAGAVLGEPLLADDHDVGAVTGAAQRVGAGVDPDQHRVLLADEPAQPAQVLAVVVAADHDDDRPAGDPGPGARARRGRAAAAPARGAGTRWCCG